MFLLKEKKIKKVVLVIAAHPDDEILGCGATINRLVEEGADVYTLILGEGITSRDDIRDAKKRKNELEELRLQANCANELLGVKKVYLSDFPDNRFDTVAFLDIVKAVGKIKKQIQPRIVFTHFRGDLNIDHRITYKAVLTACRPIAGETVKEIYSFEVPSSTEWNYPLSFSPNFFVDVSKNIKKKQEALKIYENELREYPHPRSIESIENRAKYWGSTSGLGHAEAFEVVRVLKY